MMANGPTMITVKEYEPTEFPHDAIPQPIIDLLYHKYREKITIESLFYKAETPWKLTAKGWVGFIPVTPEFTLAIQPKVALKNLFRMWEYAYKLNSFHFLDGLIDCQSLEEFYEHLASVLARRVLDRSRKGLYCEYSPMEESLPYIRGRINLSPLLCKPWETSVECRYEEHTADIVENQLLMWTLWKILRSGLCRNSRVTVTLRQAYRSLHGLAALQPFRPHDCLKRIYNRLNQDYHPLHALCYFFLEHSGPTHESGEHTMLPFLVNMARLYERFVAEWLKVHLPPQYALNIQEHIVLDEDDAFSVEIDLVVQNSETGETIVLDTKYKAPDKPSQADINQMIAYATFKACRKAMLIYPTELATPLNISRGNVHVRSLTFSLDTDPEQAGDAFLQVLLGQFREF